MARSAPGSQTATTPPASEQGEGWSQWRTVHTKNHWDAHSLVLSKERLQEWIAKVISQLSSHGLSPAGAGILCVAGDGAM